MGYIPSPFTPDELLEEAQKSLEDFLTSQLRILITQHCI